MPIVDPDRAIHAPGPWEHRDVAANAARFHLVECGSGPAVLLVHGFPLYWWTWRRQLVALAEAGYRAIAMDLRGYGGSDHTPHSYDPFTLCADIAGVIRCLGEQDAVVVGHGWGGALAWSLPALQGDVVRAIAPIGMPHPLRMRHAAFHPRQFSRLGYMLTFQLPFLPEHLLTRNQGERIGRLLRQWSREQAWSEGEIDMYRSAFLRWPTAHTAIEYHRWSVRSIPRTDGLRYRRELRRPIDVPVLHLHGRDDPMILPESCLGSADYVTGPYTFQDIDSGHFPHEEQPDAVTAILLDWLGEISR